MAQYLSGHRLPRLVLLGLLLLVQFGLVAHQIEHAVAGTQAHCALCVVADHLGHAPVSASIFAGISSIFLLLSVSRSPIVVPRRVLILRGARAPPRFSSP